MHLHLTRWSFFAVNKFLGDSVAFVEHHDNEDHSLRMTRGRLPLVIHRARPCTTGR
ncbi:protein of unknown function [Aminobacter niigataensis]|nr:protein of unknown function [Aminobacter niigataensis]